jgi:dTMP kinase
MTTPATLPPRGRLIVFEGAEGAGKTTQAARLADALRDAGAPAVIVREPGATWLGEKIRGLLLDAHVDIDHRAEVFLFLAARAQLVPDIREHLTAGTTVIADRFLLSTYAYQVAGRGLPAELVQCANTLAVGDLVPDLTLLLSLPVGAGMARKQSSGAKQDRMERAGVDFHDRVAAAFEACVSPAWQRTHPECGPIVGIDASGAEPAVGARVRAAVTTRWPGML